MMSRGGEELIGIHGENVEAYMLDSPINNTLSAVEGSSGSDSTTLSPLPRSLYEGNHEQSLTPTVHDFSGSTTNFNHISTAHLTPLEPNSFMPDKNEFGFAGLNTVFSETNDFLHFDELPFYSPTSSIGDMSLISNSGPFALSPSLQGLGTEFMGYELNPTDDFRVEHMSHTRREDSSMGNLVTANGNFNSPTSIHSHGTSENTPVLHPQTLYPFIQTLPRIETP
ncbi:hypothetical protein N431DRAFT_562691 [Stipitochalara longipes BDJ]|nr:hypothetical protein N431DRAFT_562691 [Stipitochalara longipes BDJ]